MNFIFADAFLSLFASNRTCWLRGRYGSGKTTTAFWLADWLYATGRVDRILTNIGSPQREYPISIPVENAAIVLDESWLFLDTWSAVREYAGFLRKNNLYLIMPSVFPPHGRLRQISLQRWFNGMVTGVPIWVYRWDLSDGAVKEKGYFALWNPGRVFGQFDTKSIPSTDDDTDGAVIIPEGFTPKTPKTPATARAVAVRKNKVKEDAAVSTQEQVVQALQNVSQEIEGSLSDTSANMAAAVESIRRVARRYRGG
jgi:hypothetical protein